MLDTEISTDFGKPYGALDQLGHLAVEQICLYTYKYLNYPM